MTNAYLELKVAWELYKKLPESLSEADQLKTKQIAARQEILEKRILSAPEASAVVIPEQTLNTRLAEIKKRYTTDEEFEQDIAHQGLTLESLRDAVTKDLRMEAVLEKIASTITLATDTDAEIFYRLNPQAFDQPELRKLRHILITFDNDVEQQKGINLLNRLRGEIKTTKDFANAALRYSQCPTAMEGGVLGKVKRGQLYPELEPVAFGLRLGEMSEVTVSPMGLHILRCEEIQPGGLMEFTSIRENIVERLNDQRQAQAQREWIKGLPTN
ncbi:MAG: nitrogen fixation protein NifM [Pseudomonadota bacterium]|jgi:peptidylprolyl isomerase/peptidyl-prolyl cis-trans isomerase C